ncbi:MAG: hypothetical protein GY928_01780, partial [Colwellia sp.]|nr:hypothetical protein [Colwellia sp.]
MEIIQSQMGYIYEIVAWSTSSIGCINCRFNIGDIVFILFVLSDGMIMTAPTIGVNQMVFIVGIIQWIVFMEAFVTNRMDSAYFINVLINYTFITVMIDVQQILAIMVTNCTYFMIIICIVYCDIIFYAIFHANWTIIIQNSITAIASVIMSVNVCDIGIRI